VVIRIAKRLGLDPPGLRNPPSESGPPSAGMRWLSHPTSPVAERRGEILSATYAVATLGAIAVWAAAPRQVLNVFGVGTPIVLAGAAAVAFLALRHHLPRYAEDVAVVASLALLGVGIAYMRDAAIFTPYYVWVGFSAPLWFPPRRAVGYLVLTTAACGADMLLAGTAAALASWFATVAILVIAFFIVLLLTRTLVNQGRLASMGEMTLVMGHEIRNPLSVITNAHWLLHEAVDRGDTASAKRQIERRPASDRPSHRRRRGSSLLR
jgi:signal transduction histidine kinase